MDRATFDSLTIPRIQSVTLKGMDRPIYIREMTVADADWVFGWNSEAKPSDRELSARIAVKCLCDETGKRMYTDDEAAAMRNKPFRLLNQIVEAANALHGFRADGEKSEEA